jgi:hypothetical protein
MAGGAERGENRGVSGRGTGRGGTGWGTAVVGLLLGCLLLVPTAAIATPPGDETDLPAPPPEVAPGAEASSAEPAWLDSKRLNVERGLGGLIDTFDRFFGDERHLDVESPSTRFRFKGYGRYAQDEDVSGGGAVAVSVKLPRMEQWLGNARLILVGENTSTGAPVPLAGNVPPAGESTPISLSEVAAPDPSLSRGRAELRFDVIRRGVLVFDTSAGFTFAWPPVPFARFRAHVRLALGAGFVLRATEVLFVELGGRGAGTNTDLLVERFLGTAARLRWEGHGVFAQKTRGIEWSTLVGAEWKVHPRTGLYASVGASGFGTPAPGLDVWRTLAGVRQDLWSGWIFAELEPEASWPRLPGLPRSEVLAVTLRLEVVIDGRSSVKESGP